MNPRVCRACAGERRYPVNSCRNKHIPTICKCDVCDGTAFEPMALAELPNLIYYANYLIARAMVVRKTIHDLK